MLGAISGVNAMTRVGWTSQIGGVGLDALSRAGHSGAVYASGHNTTLHTPVQPVEAAKPVLADASGNAEVSLPTVREGADPAEMAVRMRMRFVDEASRENGQAVGVQEDEEAKTAQEVMEEAECQTCKERKYQDGSDDPGVSFQTPGHIDASVSASVVRGHEMEHVVREQAQAKLEGREVVRQSVTLHNAICPECGRVYVSGGTTRTTTAAAREYQANQRLGEGNRKPGFEAAA